MPSTRLVNVVVKDGDPERAASIANAIAAAYIEKTLEDRMRSTVTALEWLDGQLTALRSDLEASDPWGTRIRLRVEVGGFELRSAGYDGRFGNADDFVQRGELSP